MLRARSMVQTATWFFLVLIFIGSFSLAEESPVRPPGSATSSVAMNPNLSLIGLFSLTQFSIGEPLVFEGGHDPKISGFNTQQIELTLGASVDPYLRADANLVLVPEGGEIKVEIEEAYATTLDFPWGLQLKAGAFFSAFGRQNPQHPHAWSFVNKPLILGRMFGGDGMRNPGAQLSWLTPLPWYSEIIGSAQNSSGETMASFRGDLPMRDLSDGTGLIRWNNFFALSEELSLIVGGSYARGTNAEPDPKQKTQLLGADLYLKFRRPSSLSFLSLEVEALNRRYGTAAGDLSDWGWYAQVLYRLGEPWHRWHVGFRYDWVGDKQPGAPSTSPGPVDPTTGLPTPTDLDTLKRFRLSPVVSFYPSEFSKVRFQYDYDRPNGATPVHAVSIQLEFLMGAHGAHKF